MTTLLIDAGNSSLKWALLHNGQLETGKAVVYQWSSLEEQLEQSWQSFSEKNTLPTKIVLANVAGQRVLDAIGHWRDEVLGKEQAVKERGEVTIECVVAQASAFGVINGYQQPETLGADRWAALVAARHHEKGGVCIIDCGTALTIDILMTDGEHKGGMIAPGWKMMENSLVADTKGIHSGESEVPELLGENTQQAVQAGISAACAGAVGYIVQRFQHDMGETLKCVVTGGAASMLLPKLLLLNPLFLKSVDEFQHEPDWVLKGLAVISGEPVGSDSIGGSGEMS